MLITRLKETCRGNDLTAVFSVQPLCSLCHCGEVTYQNTHHRGPARPSAATKHWRESTVSVMIHILQRRVVSRVRDLNSYPMIVKAILLRWTNVASATRPTWAIPRSYSYEAIRPRLASAKQRGSEAFAQRISAIRRLIENSDCPSPNSAHYFAGVGVLYFNFKKLCQKNKNLRTCDTENTEVAQRKIRNSFSRQPLP
jgi:hypothetical protein